jgi:hypothetical protein
VEGRLFSLIGGFFFGVFVLGLVLATKVPTAPFVDFEVRANQGSACLLEFWGGSKFKVARVFPTRYYQVVL